MAEQATFQGKVNIYVYEACRGHIVTRDRDAGTTPFMTACHATVGCKGKMQSSMYRVFNQDVRESHEWYRPSALEVVPTYARQHVAMGGLLLRKVTDTLPDALNGDGPEADNHECLAKRRPGEPMFILLGRDPDAHNLVRLWAERRLLAGGDPDHCRMGLDTSAAMRTYADEPANHPSSAPAAAMYPPLAPSQLGPDQGWRPTHYHVKTGRLYRLVSSATLQTSTPLGDEAFLALYQGENGLHWVRPADEFWDGRFALCPVPDWLKVEPHRLSLTDEEKDRILAEEGLDGK